MKALSIAALCTAMVLTNCVSIEKVKADALQQAQDHCTSEGKQFIHGVVKQRETDSTTMVVVSGQCVGPDDPGYITPNSDKH